MEVGRWRLVSESVISARRARIILKSEAPNPKEIQNPKSKSSKTTAPTSFNILKTTDDHSPAFGRNQMKYHEDAKGTKRIDHSVVPFMPCAFCLS